MNDDNYYTTEQVQQLYGLTSANICKTVSLRTRKIKDDIRCPIILTIIQVIVTRSR